MTPLADALADAGGFSAARERSAQLRALLLDELDLGARELALARSGRERPVLVAVTVDAARLLAVAPVPAGLRADPDVVSERGWLLVAALAGALVEAAGTPPPAGPGDLVLGAAAFAEDWLTLALPLLLRSAPAQAADTAEAAELAALAFESQVAPVDRLRAVASAVPAHVLDGVDAARPPIGPTHPLRVAEAVARLGGRPADLDSVAAHEDGVLALLEDPAELTRPHDDPDPARRVARRILQRLAGMGKWGGYHTDVAHLARGFAGNDRALAVEVGDRLLAAGLLDEKPSVGQRHVFLDPRRAADIHALIERGESPPGLDLDLA